MEISAADLFPDSAYPPTHTSTYGSPISGDSPPATSPKFAPGWCGMHVTQYQKNSPSDSNAHSPEYLHDVSIFDANQNPIIQIHDCNNCGTTSRTTTLKDADNVFKTDLPVDKIVTVGAVDDDAILFRYGDLSWGSNDHAHHSNWSPLRRWEEGG